jgi:leucyl-tRNA synthetase
MADFSKIARKWQKKWEEEGIFKVKEDSKKKKFYCLEMYPYPSGSGLHMGHVRNYCIGDTIARFKRMQGFNVLYPMGYDSFGLPAENAAIKAKSHPKIFTEEAIKNFIRQQKALGLSYDWTRMIASHKPEYYKWDQWIFLKMFEKGLAYKKKSAVNWCPDCNTVLANEQVHDGKCWRHSDTEVEPKELEQWFFRITKYASELLEDIKKLKGWEEDVKIMQRNWIGKSYGVTLKFDVYDENDKKVDQIETFTTRVDTVYGITYLILAVEHPKLLEWVKGTRYEKDAKKFIADVKKQSIVERTSEGKEKNGMFIGKYFINPFTNKKYPIWTADYALYDYGTGAVMAVPAHDQRDFEFARKYKLPIGVVINPEDHNLSPEKMVKAFVEEGVMGNSKQFDGMGSKEAMKEIAKLAAQKKWGKKTVNYKLKDWLLSRQRFWGCPIPMIYCDKCGIVPDHKLPVILPEKVEFTGQGNPLESCKEFVNTTCPKCKGRARRETDTMDTFVDSSWYFLRYCDADNDKEIFDPKKANYWMPIDRYIGGKEHATMHLIYFRFFTKFLRDLGLIKVDEPTINLFNQGMLHKNGFVMSKSRGNVVTQEDIQKKYGIDTARLFLMFVSSPDKDMEWDDKAIEGSFRFLNKFYRTISEKKKVNEFSKIEESKINKTAMEVTKYIEEMQYNKALISIMQFTNFLANQEKISKKSAEKLVKVLSVFVPHICEELWEQLGNKGFISLEKWPSYDEKKINQEAEAIEEVLEKTKKDIYSVMELAKIEAPENVRIFVADAWKYDFIKKLKEQMAITRNIGEIMKVLSKDFGTYMKEISKIVPRLAKDETKLPKVVIDRKKELDALKKSVDDLKQEFKCDIEVIEEKDSQEGKAKQAMPGKVAILVK